MECRLTINKSNVMRPDPELVGLARLQRESSPVCNRIEGSSTRAGRKVYASMRMCAATPPGVSRRIGAPRPQPAPRNYSHQATTCLHIACCCGFAAQLVLCNVTVRRGGLVSS